MQNANILLVIFEVACVHAYDVHFQARRPKIGKNFSSWSDVHSAAPMSVSAAHI